MTPTTTLHPSQGLALANLGLEPCSGLCVLAIYIFFFWGGGFGFRVYRVSLYVSTPRLEALELRNVLGALRRIAFSVTFASGGYLRAVELSSQLQA